MSRRRKKQQKYQKEKHDGNHDFEPLLRPETKRGIGIIFLLTISAIATLGLLNIAGLAGIKITLALGWLFGAGAWLFPILTTLIAVLIIIPKTYRITFVNYLGIFLLTTSLTGLLQAMIKPETLALTAVAGKGGGYFGLFLAWPLLKILGRVAALIILFAVLIIAVLITFNTSLEAILGRILFFRKFFVFLGEKFNRDDELEEEFYDEMDDSDTMEKERDDEIKEAEEEPRKNFSQRKIEDQANKNIFTVSEKKYKKVDVPLDLLSSKVDKPSSGDIRASQERIRKTLENFGISIELDDVSVGPTVTQYTFKPADGVKLSQIITLHNDLALALAAHPIRIEAPIPGKSLVGIEVPNQTIATVGLREILSSREFATRKSNLTIALGKDVAGKPWIANIDTMPHMLVAGATGSGKTVCINTILVSLLYQNSPETLRLILVDPKRVELPVYNGIPHLITPAITDVKKTINALKWAIAEMDRRFEILSQSGSRDISGYNKKAARKMPYLIIVIDELADLMATSASEVEGYIIRLAQMARAVGIHLILATQRPSVDVITGLIKANITTRIAFAVASSMDSRTILDCPGAEKLLGRGDMLFTSASLSMPKRLQGAFVSDDEIRKVVDYIKSQNGEPEYDNTILEKQPSIAGIGFADDDDELLEEARDLVVKAGKASASYLQRRFKIGYARAARILDLLEERGIVGPADGAKPREVYIDGTDSMNPTSGSGKFFEPYSKPELTRDEDKEIIAEEEPTEETEQAGEEEPEEKIETQNEDAPDNDDEPEPETNDNNEDLDARLR